MEFAVNQFQILSSFFIFNIPFNFNSWEYAFEKFLKKAEEGVVWKYTVNSFWDCNLEIVSGSIRRELLKFYWFLSIFLRSFEFDYLLRLRKDGKLIKFYAYSEDSPVRIEDINDLLIVLLFLFAAFLSFLLNTRWLKSQDKTF